MLEGILGHLLELLGWLQQIAPNAFVRSLIGKIVDKVAAITDDENKRNGYRKDNRKDDVKVLRQVKEQDELLGKAARVVAALQQENAKLKKKVDKLEMDNIILRLKDGAEET